MIYRIVLVFLFFQVGFRGNAVLTTLYAVSLGADTMTVGIIIALAALFPMIFAIYAGRISDRVGYRLPLISGSFGVSLSLLLPFIVEGQLYILFVSQSLFGLAFIFLLVNIQNLIGGIGTTGDRSKNYAIYSLGISVAGLLGPVIAGFSIDHFGYNSTYLLLSIMAAVPGIIIALNIIRIPQPETSTDRNGAGIRELLCFRPLRKTYITSAMILIGVGLYELFFPIYGNRIGLSASSIGLILSVNASAYFAVRLMMPYLIKRYGEDIVIIACLIISASTFIFMPLTDRFIDLAVISFILGLGLGCGQPLSILMTYNYSPKGRTGEVLGLRLAINKVVQFSVPVLFGSVGNWVGFVPIFWANASLLFIGGLISIFDRRTFK